jgi:CO/xanthine dehydrogenase FAD-binding subunit
MALNAELVLISKDSQRTVKLADFYTNDGMHPFAIEPGELLKEIIVPSGMTASAYERLSYRSAIDYPIVCAGAALKAVKGIVDAARIAVGAIGRSPLYLAQASGSLKGKVLTDEDAFRDAAFAAMESAAAFAVHNAGATLEYRCEMIEPMVFRALKGAVNTLLEESSKDGATP